MASSNKDKEAELDLNFLHTRFSDVHGYFTRKIDQSKCVRPLPEAQLKRWHVNGVDCYGLVVEETGNSYKMLTDIYVCDFFGLSQEGFKNYPIQWRTIHMHEDQLRQAENIRNCSIYDYAALYCTMRGILECLHSSSCVQSKVRVDEATREVMTFFRSVCHFFHTNGDSSMADCVRSACVEARRRKSDLIRVLDREWDTVRVYYPPHLNRQKANIETWLDKQDIPTHEDTGAWSTLKSMMWSLTKGLPTVVFVYALVRFLNKFASKSGRGGSTNGLPLARQVAESEPPQQLEKAKDKG
eukprot:CAMPEP_0113900788 /NCGR_PEP_ID=MMETSP0780_2-20120614/20879_1 /TAXON_ID=652834 /ORGANISM="Palpitomonas bilix" /LENGTH=297 /DNA_ID=CAMNT_0000893301 /DNA_START=89 /DNA_END=977 /DNA_ORIENTATION=+ /assembly_acc=CAM_ASM_000599